MKGIRLANIVCRGPGPIDIADLSRFVGTTLKTQLSTVVATQKPPEIMTQEQGTYSVLTNDPRLTWIWARIDCRVLAQDPRQAGSVAACQNINQSLNMIRPAGRCFSMNLKRHRIACSQRHAASEVRQRHLVS